MKIYKWYNYLLTSTTAELETNIGWLLSFLTTKDEHMAIKWDVINWFFVIYAFGNVLLKLSFNYVFFIFWWFWLFILQL